VYVGIDVAAAYLHCVAIHTDGSVAFARLVDADEIEALAQELAGAEVVAIDAPSDVSTRPHLDDSDPNLSAKFRQARCAELCLGRQHGIWVPWVAPFDAPKDGWLLTGLRAFAVFRSADAKVIEVFPHAAFQVLRGSRLPPKRSADGVRARVEALAERGVTPEGLEMWSHDGLDALVAAVVARDYSNGDAVKVTCGHDDSAIWLPANGAPA
jgi:predicted nuclease with RNAse H fold